MKRIVILLLGVFILTLFPVIPTQAAEFQANVGKVSRDTDSGIFNSLDFAIKSTAHATGTVWRTDAITVRFGTKSVTFTHADLEAKGFFSAATDQVISFTAADFEPKGISAGELQNHSMVGNFAIEPTIAIYTDGVKQAETGNIQGVDALVDKYFNGNNSIRTAIKTRWGVTSDPQKPTTEYIDLEMTSLGVIDHGGSMAGTIVEGQPCTIHISVDNDSSIAGSAPVRAWLIRGKEITALTPGTATFQTAYQTGKTYDWRDIRLKPGTYQIVSSINCVYDFKTGGVYPEKFEGREEVDYMNNYKIINLTVEEKKKDPKPEEGTPPPEPPSSGDLSIYNIELLNIDGNSISAPLPGTTCKIRVKVASTFGTSGEAKVRLYVLKKFNSNYSGVGNDRATGLVLQPKETDRNMEWDLSLGTGEYLFIASVDYRRTGDDTFEEELFCSQKETTYTNNKVELGCNTKESEFTFHPPIAGIQSQVLYYPPLKENYKTVSAVERRPVYGWQKVPINQSEEKPRIKIRLVR